MKILVLFFLVLSTSLFSEPTKTIFLISSPRSLSVGFLRMMQARQDFEIFHEPSNAPYDKIYYQEFYAETFRANSFQSFEEATQAILEKAKTSNVFIKDVSFCCAGLLTKDNPLLKSAHFAFLIRKPQDVILSLYRRKCPVGFIQNVAGYEPLYALFKLVKDHGKYPPYLFLSEDLGSNPSQAVAKFCECMEIAFKPESLHWEDLGWQFDGLQWHDGKIPEAIHHWHGDAIHSTCFLPLSTAEIDEEGVPTFSEIPDFQDRKDCREAYSKQLPYYQALLQDLR